jgi:hypothetical protein
MERYRRLSRQAMVAPNFSWPLAIMLAVLVGLPLAGYLLLIFG